MSYKLIQQTDSQLVNIKFNDLFQGETVTWHTQFFTLNGYVERHKMIIIFTNSLSI